MSDLVNDILGCTDEILSIRDDLGAKKYQVSILTRVWSGTELGDGTPVDSVEKIYPSPYIVDYSQSLRLSEGGNVKEGDILLKNISRQSYANESDLDCSTNNKNIEKFYFINNRLYNVVSITRHYVYWNVMVRQTNKKKIYL